MDVIAQINSFQEFIKEFYYAELLENLRKDKPFLIVDFSLLAKLDPSLAEELLDHPEEVIKASEIAIKQFDIDKPVRIRFKNLPKSQQTKIKNIRSIHLGRLLYTEGIIRQKSNVRPQVTSARFECPNCGNIMNILQLEETFKEPQHCGCGRKGKFMQLSKELVDAQGLVLEEAPEALIGGEQPQRMNIFLKDDLVSPMSEKHTSPGNKITVVGMLKEIPIVSKTGAKSTRFDLMIEANYVEASQETFYEVNISPEDEQKILAIARDPRGQEKLVSSLAPSIYGYERIKEALLTQMVGGSQKVRSDNVTSRGDIHILLVGDPGAGKSALLKRMATIAPKGRYVSGKGASGAGLTASVVRDEFLKGWSLEAGAMVLASDGVCIIDELDKMSNEDRSAMHEALENQTVSISKANIQATLIARTTVLAAANPKLGRFDPYGIIADQIDLPPALINRFDLIFPIKDLPDEKRDALMAQHILALHQTPELNEAEISTETLRKYISYARQKVNPKLTNEAISELQEFYLKMRMSGSGEGAIRAIPISARQLEALVRMSEASARLRLSNTVTKRDAQRAIDLLEYCLLQVGLDKETGQIDIDRIATGIGASQRNVIHIIKEIITEFEDRFNKIIPLEEIVKEAKNRGIEESKVEEILEKLRRTGDIFEPRRGFVSKL